MRLTLDARRLLCPLPVIRTQDKVKQLHSGDELEIICTDSGVLYDIPLWCKLNKHKVLETRTEGYEYIVIIQVT